MARSLQALLLLALLGGCRRPVPVTPPPPTARPAAEPAAVRLLVIDFDTLALTEASAFVSADGLLATCAHVIAAGTPLGVVLRDGRRATVTEVVATDEASDVALLRADLPGLPSLPLAAGPAARGQMLLAVTKDGNSPVACLGAGVDGDVGHVTTFDAAEHGPRASGGALVDEHDRVVGVIRGGFEDGGREGVAVPVGRLVELLAEACDGEDGIARVQPLEERIALAIFTVTDTADAGPGSTPWTSPG